MMAITGFLPRLVGAVALVLGGAVISSAQDTTREITRIAGNLYRFQNNFHFSVFLVTADGIIATDPIDADAARWLRDELKSRFDKPVKYLVYSHDHADHVSGGEVFADEAIVIAHDDAREAIIGEERPTAVPELTFSERLTLELGGERVELIYPGRSHSNNSIVMHFPAERALFAVDFISVDSLPYRDLPDSYFPDWIGAVRAVEKLDFDILVPGHGPVGTKADATEHRQYLEALYEAVLQAAREGQTLEQMKESIDLEAFGTFSRYEEWLPLNIEGMYRRISLHRRANP